MLNYSNDEYMCQKMCHIRNIWHKCNWCRCSSKTQCSTYPIESPHMTLIKGFCNEALASKGIVMCNRTANQCRFELCGRRRKDWIFQINISLN